jgi:hypothetical protein
MNNLAPGIEKTKKYGGKMTALTTSQINHLNRMNRAAQDVALGTRIAADELAMVGTVAKAITSGSYPVTSSEISGSRVVIPTTLGTITWFDVNVLKSGSPVTGLNVVNSSGSLLVYPSAISGSWIMATTDVVYWAAK